MKQPLTVLLFALLSVSLVLGLVYPLKGRVLSLSRPQLDPAFRGEVRQVFRSDIDFPTNFKLFGDPSFSDDLTRAALALGTTGGDAHAYLWTKGESPTQLSEGALIEPNALAISPDGTVVAFLSKSGDKSFLHLWEEGFGERPLLRAAFSGLWVLAVAPYGRQIVVAPRDDVATVHGKLFKQDYNKGSLIVIRREDRAQPLRGRRARRRKIVEVSQHPGWRGLETIVSNGTKVAKIAATKTDVSRHIVRAYAAKTPLLPNDVDGDGAADLLVFDRGAELPVWRAYTTGGYDGAVNAVSGITGNVASWRVGDNNGIPVPGDYNGDGLLDLATYTPGLHRDRNRPLGNWQLYFSRARNLTQHQLLDPTKEHRSVSWGIHDARAVPADYDGDGATDIAVLDPASYRWHVLLSSGGFNRAKGSRALKGYGYNLQFGRAGDIPVVGDYDADGRADLAVYRPATKDKEKAKWLFRPIRLTEKKPKNVSFGKRGDIAVPGDYDCDGKTDVAVYRPKKGQWLIRVNDEETRTVSFSKADAVPVVSDFDGDGCDDFALFSEASTPNWHILPSGFKENAREIVPHGRNITVTASWGNASALPVQVLLGRHQRGESE